MPFTTLLKPFPRIPNEQAPIVQPSLLPAKEFTTFLTGLRDWAATITAGLGESGATVRTVAQLPAAAAGNQGTRYIVTDATATTFNSVVAGGGANIVPVFSTGAAWRIG